LPTSPSWCFRCNLALVPNAIRVCTGTMRSIWKGSIAFGLVNVPVKVYGATEDHDVELHQVHDKDGGRIRYQRRCDSCGRVVDFEHISKAYQDGDQTVVLTEADFGTLPEQRSREIEVVEFVPSDQVDPIMFERSYFLEPDSQSPKAYVLLRRTLEETDRTAIVHFSLRQKTRLGALRVHGDVLMLQSLLWDDEVREAKFPALDSGVRISAKELEMSSALVDSFAADFSPDKFSDDYQDQLRQLIESKLSHGDSVDTSASLGADEQDQGGEILDLMDALRRSIAKNGGASATGSQTGSKSGTKSGTKTGTKSGSQRASTGSTPKKHRAGRGTGPGTSAETKSNAAGSG
jgi:DNA end-binding protein Ku